MLQPEDTELRDLVIEALEKNGTLPTIRAQLRANIFNVFETEQQIRNENSNDINRIFLDNDSCLSFSIIYEFLEYCGLKNTLFVYKSESRHGKGYVYEGKQKLIHKLNSELKPNETDEPILCHLIKTLLKNSSNSRGDNTYKRYVSDRGDIENDHRVSYGNEDVPPLITFDTPERNSECIRKDEENSTYIVHDDTASFGSCAHSQSDHSLDQHKLQLKLHLQQSETDTSSTDSNRDKSSSDEYIPCDNIPPGLILNESHTRGFCSQTFSNDILMQSPISVSLVPHANRTFSKSDNKLLSEESFNEKYASGTFDSTSYMNIRIEPKVRQESVIKIGPSIENGHTSTPVKGSNDIETKQSNSYSDCSSAMTKYKNYNSLLQSSHLTPDENNLNFITQKSQSNTFRSLKSHHRCVEGEDLENKILMNISSTTEISKQKLETDLSRSSSSNSKNKNVNENPACTSIVGQITAPEYTNDLNSKPRKSEEDSIESVTHRSNTKSDSDSIQEEINITNNNSEIEESPRDFNSCSSISISDVAELIENSRIDSSITSKTSSPKKTNSRNSHKPHIEKSTDLFNEKNITIGDNAFKEMPSNKNITLRSCSNLKEDEKAKFLTNTYDVDTYSDSFSQTISNIQTENMEWKSESI